MRAHEEPWSPCGALTDQTHGVAVLMPLIFWPSHLWRMPRRKPNIYVTPLPTAAAETGVPLSRSCTPSAEPKQAARRTACSVLGHGQ
jgi:hypothetical protein